MKQTIMSLMLVGFVLLATGTGTYAYFSDSETSTGNEFMAGTFALDISGSSLPLQTANIMPGWNTDDSIAKSGTDHGVKNVGTAPGEVYIIARNFEEPTEPYNEYPENGGVEVGPKDFADVMQIKVFVDIDDPAHLDNEFTDDELVYEGPLRDLHTPSFSVDPQEYVNCYFEAYMPLDLNDGDNTFEDTLGGIPAIDGNEDDNAYQADGVRCEIVFMGTTEISIGID